MHKQFCWGFSQACTCRNQKDGVTLNMHVDVTAVLTLVITGRMRQTGRVVMEQSHMHTCFKMLQSQMHILLTAVPSTLNF